MIPVDALLRKSRIAHGLPKPAGWSGSSSTGVPLRGKLVRKGDRSTPFGGILDSDETSYVLTEALLQVHGVRARLEGWAADDHFTGYGKRRVVRYDVLAEVGSRPRLERYQWLGKFYEHDDEARRIAAVLREVSREIDGRHNDIEVPTVLTYHSPRRLLLMTYETGDSVAQAIAHGRDAIMPAVGRALAALHGIPINPARVTSPADRLRELRPFIADLCAWYPDDASELRQRLETLEREAATHRVTPSFVHGDFGPANLLWRDGHIVVLDFDQCARGDPAVDLGNLFVQLRRISLRSPETLPDYPSARAKVLVSYRLASPLDPTLEDRIRWYERAILLRKIHRLIFSPNRSQEPEARRRRQVEADQLLRLR